MNLKNNTILITGGTSGIGLELARQLLQLGNTVIITGRDQSKLNSTKQMLPGIYTVQSDVSNPQEIITLYERVTYEFPNLNMLINKAGIMRKIDLHDRGRDLEDITREIQTNLAGPIRMVQQFLPHLKKQKKATIVNVSSGLAFIPLPISPIYCATKAALHSYTLSLRVQLKNTNITVFELAPPGTETPLFRGEFTKDDLGGMKGMDVETLSKRTIAGLQKDNLEIRPGLSSVLQLMSRIAPQFMLKAIGTKSVDIMLAQVRQ